MDSGVVVVVGAQVAFVLLVLVSLKELSEEVEEVRSLKSRRFSEGFSRKKMENQMKTKFV
jgi:hypothetical protein